MARLDQESLVLAQVYRGDECGRQLVAVGLGEPNGEASRSGGGNETCENVITKSGGC